MLNGKIAEYGEQLGIDTPVCKVLSQVVRCIQGKPVLNLTIDAQSGTAGLETRVESFIDILRYQKKGGYVGA